MRILVTADTHIPDWYHELPGRLVEDARKSDLVLLAGDIVSRQVIDTLASCALVEAAYGNFCDDELKRSLPSKKTLELSGRKVGLTTAISGRGTTLMKNLSVSSMEGSMCSFTATRIILIKEKLEEPWCWNLGPHSIQSSHPAARMPS